MTPHQQLAKLRSGIKADLALDQHIEARIEQLRQKQREARIRLSSRNRQYKSLYAEHQLHSDPAEPTLHQFYASLLDKYPSHIQFVRAL